MFDNIQLVPKAEQYPKVCLSIYVIHFVSGTEEHTVPTDQPMFLIFHLRLKSSPQNGNKQKSWQPQLTMRYTRLSNLRDVTLFSDIPLPGCFRQFR